MLDKGRGAANRSGASFEDGQGEWENGDLFKRVGWRLMMWMVDKRALPRWRYQLRQQAIPLIRWETPYLAWMQEKLRTPALDSYFAITANLGTHTFFMIGLPICFWCGWASLGKGYVGIFFFDVYDFTYRSLVLT